MTKEEVRRKMQKLSALANRGVGGEMENAKKILEQLMSEYNVSTADIMFDELRMPGKRFETWMSYLLCDVAENCGCFVVRQIEYNDTYRKLIGERLNTEVAKELYVYLRDYVLRIAAQEKIPREDRLRFKESITEGICKKLRENKMVWIQGSEQSKKVHDLWCQDKTIKTVEKSINANNEKGLKLGLAVNLQKQASGSNMKQLSYGM